MEKNIFNFWRLLLVLLLAGAVAGFLYWAGAVLPKDRQNGKVDGKFGAASDAGSVKPEPGMVAVARNIRVDYPVAGEKISSPLKIRGQARGDWFFEGVFPIQLIDNDGQVMASGQAKAQGEWMTEDFVDFSAELPFVLGETRSATLIFSRDNPSGLPENAEQLEIQVGL